MVQRLDRFVTRLRETEDLDSLEAIMIELTFELGFEQFALGHHVDLTRPPRDAVRLTNYAPDWITQSLENRFFADDPVHAVSARLVRPFFWQEIPDHLSLTRTQAETIERAKPYGLVEGFTVPVHQPGEYNGTCSFGARSFAQIDPICFSLAAMAATYAFECARRLTRVGDGVAPKPPPHFTERMREAVILVGKGKTDAEIADIMRIARSTAHDHVEAGRRAYGNAQRPHLVLRAVYDGVISFADVFDT